MRGGHEQHFGGEAADRRLVPVRHADRRRMQFGEARVACADHRDVARDGQALRADRAQHAVEHVDAACDHRGRRRAVRQQARHDRESGCREEARRADQRRVDRDTVRRVRRAIAAQALARRKQLLRPGDQRDAPVAEREQMVGDPFGGMEVVGRDRVGPGRSIAIDQHDRNVERAQEGRRIPRSAANTGRAGCRRPGGGSAAGAIRARAPRCLPSWSAAARSRPRAARHARRARRRRAAEWRFPG